MQPRFPLYIVSKGRAESRLTSKELERLRVPYRIVVEEQEREEYARHIDPAKILVLDPEYKRTYDTLDDLGTSKSTGAGPARNFVWDHAIASGAEWHWVMDDNIYHFYRLHQNAKIPVGDGTVFRCMEDFCLRYTNVGMGGPHYEMFLVRRKKWPPFFLNTRVYSCNLIRNDIPFRWRGRFNEDTILSLDVLKAGWCTILFNAFLQDKVRTHNLAGGNTAEFYKDRPDRLENTAMLVREHPDVARVVRKYGRWHHHVDYRPFEANKLRRKPGVEVPEEANNYGMRVVAREEAERAES